MTRSLAARTRDAARERPFLIEALAAGVVNYTAAARFLAPAIGREADEEAVATALRRFAAELDRTTGDHDIRVSMESGVGLVEDSEDPLLSVAGVGIDPDGGRRTALVVTGDVDAAGLGAVLGRLGTAGVTPVAAGVVGESMVVVVDRSDGADAVRIVEATFDAVPVVDTPG